MQNKQGVSLLGMIGIILILAVGAYFAAPYFLGKSKKENMAKIRQDLTDINSALEQYKLDNGMYPTTEQGLSALVEEPTTPPAPQYYNSKGYITALPLDPWGQDYQYTYTDGITRIYSYGSSGKNRGIEIDFSNIDTQ